MINMLKLFLQVIIYKFSIIITIIIIPINANFRITSQNRNIIKTVIIKPSFLIELKIHDKNKKPKINIRNS